MNSYLYEELVSLLELGAGCTGFRRDSQDFVSCWTDLHELFPGRPHFLMATTRLGWRLRVGNDGPHTRRPRQSCGSISVVCSERCEWAESLLVFFSFLLFFLFFYFTLGETGKSPASGPAVGVAANCATWWRCHRWVDSMSIGSGVFIFISIFVAAAAAMFSRRRRWRRRIRRRRRRRRRNETKIPKGTRRTVHFHYWWWEAKWWPE